VSEKTNQLTYFKTSFCCSGFVVPNNKLIMKYIFEAILILNKVHDFKLTQKTTKRILAVERTRQTSVK
jgi:hypothetical protein